MTLAGWIVMIVSWTAITLVTLITLWKSLTAKPNLSSTLEMELEEKGPGAPESKSP
jgi:hypothetical protein